MFFRFLSGKNAQFAGDLTSAISYFQPTGDDWSTFKHGCHWEMYWTHGLEGNWKKAIESIKEGFHKKLQAYYHGFSKVEYPSVPS